FRFEPYVRQPATWPRRRHVVAKQMFRPAGFIGNDGRRDVAVAQFRTDHFVGLSLLDVCDARKVVARRLTVWRGVADVRPELRPPGAAAERCVSRRADGAVADLASLDFIRPQQAWAAPSRKRRLQLP